MKKLGLIVISMVMVFSVFGCGKKETESEGTAKAKSTKSQLELVHEIDLGDIAPDKIPDINEKGWVKKADLSKPVVSPNGKYVLAIISDHISLYETESGKKLWDKSTYDGIDTYVTGDKYIYLAEKKKSKGIKDHGYIYCLDIEDGSEVWRYDAGKELKSVTEKYIPENAKVKSGCNIIISAYKDKIYFKAHDSWKEGEKNSKAEVLGCLDKEGKLLWSNESNGYPGFTVNTYIRFLNDKLILGSYSYGDKEYGPTHIQAFDVNDGKKLWQYDIKHDDNMAYSDKTDILIDVVGDKIAAMTNYGQVFILDENGEVIKTFAAWQPIKYEDTVICTNVYSDKIQGFKDKIVIAPSKSVVQGASYSTKAPVSHPEANSVLVFDLEGNKSWKFRLGADPMIFRAKGGNLFIGTSINSEDNTSKYTGVYAFNLSQENKETKKEITDESVLEKYIGFYHTDGIVHNRMLSASEDGTVICATTHPFRNGTEVTGSNKLYIFRLK
jgi:outer membrane protein assembly factor BamB